ncbi:MAG: flagellar biosynthesis protein FlgD [Planctomycetes bacterium]|nr:flagellar biosynthesis protein FlgD [Planctomycetota bacterium]
MSRISANLQFSSQKAEGSAKALGEVDLDVFIQLMLVQLQNQDPLEPMDNSEMLQQITQIRAIGSNDLLTQTLENVLRGQNLTLASSLIGQQIIALADSGETIEGEVDRVSIGVNENDNSKTEIRVHIGENSVRLNNIREITSDQNE